MQYPNVRRRLVESPQSSYISTEMEADVRQKPEAGGYAQIKIKGNIIVVKTVHDSDGSNGSKTELCTRLNGDSDICTATDGYIEFCFLYLELRHLVVGCNIKGEVSVKETKTKISYDIKIIHSILYTYTGIGTEVETYSKITLGCTTCGGSYRNYNKGYQN